MDDSKRDGRDSGEYALKVRDETTRYVKELLDENAKLRGRVSELESELGRFDGEKKTLEQRLSLMEIESRRQLSQFVDVEMQNANVANLYVASFRLHGTLEREEVLAAIREIVINLIGSEELAVFELDGSGAVLRLVSSFGVDEKRWRHVVVGDGIIGRAAQTGDLYVASPGNAAADRAAGEESLTACIPLLLDGKVTGAIAVFRMLEHKRGLEDVDHELFGLLARQAATALYCSSLQERIAAAGLG